MRYSIMFKRRTKIHFEFSAGRTSNFLILTMNKNLKSTSFTHVKQEPGDIIL